MSKSTVNISGTYSEKQRPNNGLEKVAAFLNANRLVRIPVVGYVEWHTHGETRTGEKTAVILPAVEPGISERGGPVPGLPVQDGYPVNAGDQIMWLLDSIRRAGGKGAVADTLFTVPSEEIHRDDDDDEMEGQLPAIDGDGTGLLPAAVEGGPERVAPGTGEEMTEVRLGPDGPRLVPPASGEEIMAERAETAERNRSEEKRAEIRRRVTGVAEVPAAAFTAPTGGDPA